MELVKGSIKGDHMTKESLLNAITSIPSKSKDLERRFNIAGGTIRRLVHELRKEGHHICSGNAGYWIEDDPQKYVENINKQFLPRIKSLIDLRNSAVKKVSKESNYLLQFEPK